MFSSTLGKVVEWKNIPSNNFLYAIGRLILQHAGLSSFESTDLLGKLPRNPSDQFTLTTKFPRFI